MSQGQQEFGGRSRVGTVIDVTYQTRGSRLGRVVTRLPRLDASAPPAISEASKRNAEGAPITKLPQQ